MSTKKTLYDVLGVEQTAEEKEIKKAFKRLARSLHPDVNKAEDAQEKFHEVQEAYEVLINIELREEYDRRLKEGEYSFNPVAFEDIFSMFFGGKWKPEKAINGEHIEVAVEVEVEQLLRGATAKVDLKRKRACTDCEGIGTVRSKGECAECEGQGGHKIEKRTPFGSIDTFQKCVVCEGSGKKDRVPCITCSSKGILPQREEFEFQLDPSAKFGDTLRFKHKGHAGYGGGIAGDLIVTILQTPFDKIEVLYDVDLREQRTIPLEKFLKEETYKVVCPDGTEEKILLALDTHGTINASFPEKGLRDQNGRRGVYTLNISAGLPPLNTKQRSELLRVLEM